MRTVCMRLRMGLAAALLVTGCASAPDTSWLAPEEALTASGETAHVYRSETCECCGAHALHLRQHGYTVVEHIVEDVREVKRAVGVPASHESCHTTVVGGYAVEGHVPASEIDRLLEERPAVDGIALPGMPAGSPGMGGVAQGPFDVRLFADGVDRGPAR